MEQNKHDMDDFLKDKLSGVHPEYTGSAWSEFSNRYAAEKRKRRGAWWIFGSIVFLAGGLSLWALWPSPATVNQWVQKTEKQTLESPAGNMIIPKEEKSVGNIEKIKIPSNKVIAAKPLYIKPTQILKPSGGQIGLTAIDPAIPEVAGPISENKIQDAGTNIELIAVSKIEIAPVQIPAIEGKNLNKENVINAIPIIPTIQKLATAKPIEPKPKNDGVSDKKSKPGIYIQVMSQSMMTKSIMQAKKSLTALPDWSHNERYVMTKGASLQLGWQFNKHLSIDAGVSTYGLQSNISQTWTHTDRYYRTRIDTFLHMDTSLRSIKMKISRVWIPYDSTSVSTHNSVLKYTFLTVPLNITYTQNIRKNWAIMAAGGIEMTRMTAMSGQVINEQYIPVQLTDLALPSYLWSGKVRIGLEWKPVKHMSVLLLPGIGYAQGSNSFWKQGIWQYGLETGVKWKF